MVFGKELLIKGVRVFGLLAAAKISKAGYYLALDVALRGKDELAALSNTGWRAPTTLVYQNLGMCLHLGQKLRSHSHYSWFITTSRLGARR